MQSNDIFPTLAGRDWNLRVTQKWANAVQASQALRETRISYASAPIYIIKLQYEVLLAGVQRGDAVRGDVDALSDFFHARKGRAQTFLFRHWYDSTFRDELLGAGDGSTRSFAIGRTRKGLFEPISWLDGAVPLVVGAMMWSPVPSNRMWSADASAAQWSNAFEAAPGTFTVADGRLLLPSAPAAGQPVRISGAFFYRARFENDELDLDTILQGFWKASVVLRATLGDKL